MLSSLVCLRNERVACLEPPPSFLPEIVQSLYLKINMHPDVPEEIWSHILGFLTDVDHHSSFSDVKSFDLKIWSPAPESSKGYHRYLHLIHRQKTDRGNIFVPSHIMSASMVSQAFRRLSLPLLYREMLVQFPFEARLEDDFSMHDFMGQVDSMPYADLVK